MEMSDGIDFETWNATVRSLSSAVDRLEATARLLAAPTWAEPLLASLEELTLRLQRLEEEELWLRRGIPPDVSAVSESETPPLPLTTPPAPEGAPATPDTGPKLEEPDHGSTPRSSSIPIRFGDPDAIATYGRPRRR